LGGEAKILGGGSIKYQTHHDGDQEDKVKDRLLAYLVVDTPEGVRVVCPDLLGILATRALLRKRDSALFAELRVRAVRWLRDVGAPYWFGPLVLADTVVSAFCTGSLSAPALQHLRRCGYSPPELLSS